MSVAIASINVEFLNLRKIIIWKSYLPLPQLDNRRGFWQAMLSIRIRVWVIPGTAEDFVAGSRF